MYKTLQFALIIVGTAGASTDAFAVAHNAQPVKMAGFLLAGIRDNRERLRQGVARGSGRHAALYPSKQKLDWNIEFFFAFDWNKGIFRFERKEPRMAVSYGEPNSARQEASRDVYFREPGRSVQYNSRWGEIQILREDFGVRRSLHAFDVRAVGMLYRDSYEDQSAFNEIIDLFGAGSAEEVVNEGAGVYRVRWTIANGAHRRSIWINRNEGFSITRLEVCDRRSPPMPLGNDGWPLPYLTNQATWVQIGDVWVPKTFQIEERQGANDSEPYWRYDHEFDWESVNEPLPESLFDVDKLGAKKGTLLVDYRGKAPIVERVIGIENTRLEGESPRKRDERSGSPPRPGLGMSFWLVAANAVVLLLVLIVVLWRQLRRRRGSAPS